MLGNSAPDVQGLYQIDYSVVDGVSATRIGIWLDAASIQTLAYAGEVGESYGLAYAIQMGGQTRLFRTMRVLATTFGAGASLPIGA